MRPARPFVLFLMFLATTIACAAEDPARSLTKDEWAEDLRYLARELPEKHIDPFREHDEAEFRRAVEDIESRLEDLQDHQIQVEMGRLVAMIGAGDGHTELYLPREGRGFRRLPVAVGLFRGDPRVFAALPGHEELVGARVVSIGGVPADEAYERVLPLIAHDNEVEFLLSAPVYLSVPEVLHAVGLSDDPGRATVGFQGDDGEAFERVLEGRTLEALSGASWIRARAEENTPLYAKNSGESYWYEWLESERTVYVSYRRCANQEGGPSIKRFARELFKLVDEHPVERFVLDMRANRGGNYHRSDPIINGIREREKINRPGGLYVILGRESFSAAVVTAIRLKRETEALLVGETPRSRPNGSDNFEWFHLPNSDLRVDYTDRMKQHWPELGDASKVPIDLPVESSFDDYRNGTDRVLETILVRRVAGSP